MPRQAHAEPDHFLRLSLALLLLSSACPAYAGSATSFPKTDIKANPAFSDEEPVLLEADDMRYDREADTVTATGNVSVTQGQQIMLTDRLTYNRANGTIHAEGNVSILEESGTVYFADEANLSEDMQRGLAKQFRVRMADDSLFAAREAKRIDASQTRLKGAVYSPCRVKCEDGSDKTPLWQIKASRVMIDTEEETVRYRNAFMEFYGVPVLYTPYLSHATPGAENKSGLLAPEYRHTDNLGSVYSIPVYLALSPTFDATLTPIYTSEQGLVMAGEYRQKFENGQMSFRGSITRPDELDASGQEKAGKDFRGHVFGDGAFTLNENWGWGFSVHRTTDDTYLRRYEFNKQDTQLTSRVYAEGFNFVNAGRLSYASIQGLAFQGLTAIDDNDRTPLVAPLADFAYQTEAFSNGSRLSFSGNAMSLMRDEGADSRRLSLTTKWGLPYITDGGHVFELSTQLRADAYYVNDFQTGNGRTFDGATGRLVPEASVSWRYPLINRFENANLIVEPLANFIVSPRGGNSDKIPNEDSATPEFSDLNIFSEDRFPGYDRVETGPRIHYGFRTHANFMQNRYASLLLGQNYRVNDDPLFPLTNDLRSRFSDVIGRLEMGYDPVHFTYRFRADKDNLTLHRQEVDAGINFERLNINGAYLKLDDDPVLGSREEVYGGTSLRLTKEWTANFTARQNLQANSATNAGVGLTFQNECLILVTALQRDLTSDRDVEPATSIRVQVGLKNLQ